MLPQKKKTSIALLLFQLTLAAASALVIALPIDSVSAQSLVPGVTEGVTVRIDGSSSMATVNETLKEYIETKYPDTKVTLQYRGTEEALQALREGTIDLAAIGRPLTAEEKAAGFIAYPLSRRKIAVVVSADNSFQGSLTHEQFARIFRGEIEDWSEIGGDRGKIRLIDRPETSDTRQAFLIYPIFEAESFNSGENAVKLAQDSTAALIEELDENTIGYTIADQAINRPELRILLMHNAFVTDDRYPFSQPRYYAYRKDNSSPVVKSFLGSIDTPSGKQVVESAKPGGETAISAGLLARSPQLNNKTNFSSDAETVGEKVEEETKTTEGITSAETNPDTNKNEGITSTGTNPETNTNEEIASTETNPETNDNDNLGAIANTSELSAENSLAQTSPTETAGQTENKDNDSAIFWWFFAFLGVLGLLWLWLNKQKETSADKGAIADLPEQAPPIALTPDPTELEPTPPKTPSPEATIAPPPVVPTPPVVTPEVTPTPEAIAPPPVVPTPPVVTPEVTPTPEATIAPPPVVPTPPVVTPEVTPTPEEIVPPPTVSPVPSETPAPAPISEVTPEQAESDSSSVASAAIAGAALGAIGAGAAAIAATAKEAQEPQEGRSDASKPEPVNLPIISLPSNCYGTLTVDSKANCYPLDTQQLSYLESGSNTIELNPGVYVIRIESGLFNYWPDFQQKFAGEPWVLLWFYGGKFINKKTNLEVGCTWAALNGYDDTITLEVIETVKLSALFFDTYKDDNVGQIVLSILPDR
ncbi:substrate-binding domain-containing protein [Spirulina sp. 06S082]|uniref:substrate-binding domain-containing protein n=1 Tax=Spirulina sp. 06S082 TaxID=3110248 RepID=UPI002B1F1090|nr:substrate-binding domain-containing protein [Spirulina sp. 06S082]MEA5472047.1 substrate-binding domain-containing protein [Spirulina sp. 06S082]